MDGKMCPYCNKGTVIEVRWLRRCDCCEADVQDYRIKFFDDLKLNMEIERVFGL